MGSQISSYLLYAGAGLMAVLWSLALVPVWTRAAVRRGGVWYLEGLLFICGPISTAVVAMYPSSQGAELSGPFPVINRWLTYVAIALVVVAVFRGLRQPRKNAGPVLAATAFFYLALILSCFGGVGVSFPEQYWITPLVVMAFLLHGGYTYDWLLTITRAALRVILVLSFVALLNPTIGFNYDEVRTFAGIARMQGITSHPNVFSFVVVIGLIIELSLGSRLIWKLLYVAGLLLAQSSTAFVMAAVGLVIISTRFSKAVRVLAACAAFLFACVALFNLEWASHAIDSVLPATAGTLNGRTAIWQAVTYGFQQSPVFGYGPNLLGDDYRQQYLPNFDAAAQAHNQWYQTLGGTGIVGVGSLVILGVSALFFALWSRKATRGLTVALFVTMVIRGITETPLRPSGVSVTTFCLVIVLALIASAPRDEVKLKVKSTRKSGAGLPSSYGPMFADRLLPSPNQGREVPSRIASPPIP